MLWTTRMSGLVKRGGVYIFRRRVPHRLREVIGTHEVKCSLGTGDLKVAHVRWTVKKAEVDRLFAEAEKSLVNPSVAAYKVVSTHTWSDPDAEWALDAHLTEDHHVGITPAVRDALLDRQKDSANNPPLSVVFSRYCEERNLPVKTQHEWANVVARFTEVIGGDVPIQSVTPAHVRSFKSSLLTTISERTGLVPAPATVVKLLAALKSVLSFAHSEQYIAVNPAAGMRSLAKLDPRTAVDGGRMPYSSEDLTKLFSPANLALRTNAALPGKGPGHASKAHGANVWLP
jgi:Domain of unknown function (DUF6538)